MTKSTEVDREKAKNLVKQFCESPDVLVLENDIAQAIAGERTACEEITEAQLKRFFGMNARQALNNVLEAIQQRGKPA